MTDARLRHAERAAAGDADEAALQRAVAERRRAGRPTAALLARTARWRRLADLAARWAERPLADGDGHDPAAVAAACARLGGVPPAAREWWEVAGRRRDLLGGPFAHQAVGPDRAAVHGGLLGLCVHGAGACVWGVRAVGPDGPVEDDPEALAAAGVRGRWSAEGAVPCGAPASALLTTLAAQHLLTAPASARDLARLDAPAAARVAGDLPPLGRVPVLSAAGGLPAWGAVHEGDDLLAAVEATGGGWLAARTEAARRRADAAWAGLGWTR